MGDNEAEAEAKDEESSILAQEIDEQKTYFNQQFGYHKMVKDVSDYTKTPFFELMNRAVIEVLFIVQMMLEEAEINQFQSNIKDSQ